jgi:hypothetical protein
MRPNAVGLVATVVLRAAAACGAPPAAASASAPAEARPRKPRLLYRAAESRSSAELIARSLRQ